MAQSRALGKEQRGTSDFLRQRNLPARVGLSVGLCSRVGHEEGMWLEAAASKRPPWVSREKEWQLRKVMQMLGCH